MTTPTVRPVSQPASRTAFQRKLALIAVLGTLLPLAYGFLALSVATWFTIRWTERGQQV